MVDDAEPARALIDELDARPAPARVVDEDVRAVVLPVRPDVHRSVLVHPPAHG